MILDNYKSFFKIKDNKTKDKLIPKLLLNPHLLKNKIIWEILEDVKIVRKKQNLFVEQMVKFIEINV